MNGRASPSPQDPQDHDHAFMVLLAAISVAFVWILWPFYGAVLWGVIIAIVFAPLNGWLLRRLKGRRNAAAVLTVLVVLVGVMLPLGLIAAALVQEAVAMVTKLQSGEVNITAYFNQILAAVPQWLADVLSRLGLGSLGALQQKLNASLSAGSKAIATQALGIGQNTFELIVNFFVTLYLSYFLLRDGGWLKKKVGEAVPLKPQHRSQLFDKFATVIRATVKGNVVVAATQGALGGLAFWFLDVHGALLWAVLMAVLSLLPAVGAGIVWVPVALYFLAVGDTWQGVALIVWGGLVIGLVDNLLRPLLVGKDTKLPDYLILISTLGGMAIFGLNGFVIGPLVAALFIAAWDIRSQPR